jgi:uncharacterized protein YceH (UPF0502 family)
VPELSTGACRVLGSLLEKELTVPATYPLTMNGLLSACNQTTSRDPVMSLTEPEVTTALAQLRELGLTRLVHASHGARTVKYRQVADEVWALDAGARAVVTVLLLRGPQTPGELRARGERLHPFGSVDEVLEVLEQLAARPEPLVARRPRGPGQKEHTWMHLVGGPVEQAAEPAAPTPAPAVVPDEVAPLAAFVGTWRGGGDGSYPTISPFTYTEEIELRPVPGKPMLAYRSSTRATTDGRALHGESGFVRLVDGGGVELVVAQGSGLVEVADGVLDGDELVLVSTGVTGTTTAKRVDATERRYRVDGATLTYDVAMAAVGQPLLPHLHATLHRA